MTEDPRSRLGRGLSALFDDEEPAAPGKAGGGAGTLPIADLTPGPFQPRQAFDDEAMAALIDSVKERGVIQPLIVRADPEQPGRYQIVAGERRWRAAQAAQLHEIPVVIQELSDAVALEVALIENIQRQDLTPLEEAEGYRRLTEEFRRTQEQLSRALGKSRSHISNTLRLMNLPKAVKLLLNTGAISAGHGRALLNAADPLTIAREIMRRGLTVRETERLIATDGRPAPRGPRPRSHKSHEIVRFEHDLSAMLGLKVTITPRGETGDLTIRYTSLEQFDDLMRRLLFVYILTRDIAHDAAIIELLDNSVDGARRVAENPEELSTFQVDIEFDNTKFVIEDNCGGIPLNVAREYAFRFGRAEGMQPIPGSIGQFGVGMKRALFSFGKKYIVESATEENWFRLEIRLDDWMQDKSKWDFVLADYGEFNDGKPVGTRIVVTESF